MELPKEETAGYGVHPAVGDCCIHLAAVPPTGRHLDHIRSFPTPPFNSCKIIEIFPQISIETESKSCHFLPFSVFPVMKYSCAQNRHGHIKSDTRQNHVTNFCGIGMS